jgi:apolipoprotein D and lipocalin family protein
MNDFIKIFIFIIILSGCSMNSQISTVPNVDLNKFMGKWYVIAHIPTFIEKNAFNAVESYELNKDGTIATTFTFNEGSFNGNNKIYRPKGFVKNNKTNAEWGMQFIWPIKAQYKIVYLDQNYSHTIIARDALDYVWLMSRNKKISPNELTKLTEMIKSIGYDINELRMVPQK